MTDKFVFNCVDCSETLEVKWQSKLTDIMSLAKEAGWSILKGWSRCPECKPEVKDERN